MKIEQIKPTAIIEMKFSTGFFQRLQDVVTSYTENTALEALKETYKKIQNNEVLTPWENNLETLLVLINSLEVAAREQGLVESVDMAESTK